MGKTSHQNLNALAKELTSQLQKLEKGNLAVSELEDLVHHAKEIYERLVVIRHKAYEHFGDASHKIADVAPLTLNKATEEEKPAPKTKKAEGTVDKKTEVRVETKPEPLIQKEESQPAAQVQPETPEAKPFDFTAFEDEAAKKVSEPKIAKPFSSIAADFDFSEDAFDAPAVEPEAEPIVAKEVKKPIEAIRAEVKPEVSSIHEKFLKEEVPLNKKLKTSDPQPLRKKIAKTVTDLRSEIGIGKKFEYINFLFGGDARAYEAGIDALNAAPDKEAARAKIAEFTEIYGWNTEEKTIVKFIELVERKFK
jgi:hypothetical protein